MPKPVCKGRTKAGEACRSAVLGSDGYCAVHSPSATFDPVATGRQGGKRSGEIRREQAKSVRDRLRDKVEANAETVWAAFFDGLTATNPDGSPDFRARFHAASSLLAEAYGKPVQPTHEQGRTVINVVRPPRRNADDTADLPPNVIALQVPAE